MKWLTISTCSQTSTLVLEETIPSREFRDGILHAVQTPGAQHTSSRKAKVIRTPRHLRGSFKTRRTAENREQHALDVPQEAEHTELHTLRNKTAPASKALPGTTATETTHQRDVDNVSPGEVRLSVALDQSKLQQEEDVFLYTKKLAAIHQKQDSAYTKALEFEPKHTISGSICHNYSGPFAIVDRQTILEQARERQRYLLEHYVLLAEAREKTPTRLLHHMLHEINEALDTENQAKSPPLTEQDLAVLRAVGLNSAVVEIHHERGSRSKRTSGSYSIKELWEIKDKSEHLASNSSRPYYQYSKVIGLSRRLGSEMRACLRVLNQSTEGMPLAHEVEKQVEQVQTLHDTSDNLRTDAETMQDHREATTNQRSVRKGRSTNFRKDIEQSPVTIEKNVLKELNRDWEPLIPDRKRICDRVNEEATTSSRPKSFFSVQRWPVEGQALSPHSSTNSSRTSAVNGNVLTESETLEKLPEEYNSKKVRHIRGRPPYFPFGETPLQRAWLSYQIERDLADGQYFHIMVLCSTC